ncbi:MAG: response regulator transcription factor [Burkholderiales bacterium]|nr:response regulator transcription factor [Burkholderiales bacterium]
MTRRGVLIADDHPVMRRGLRDIVAASRGYRVAGEAGDGDSAIRQLQLLRPDIALVDLAMPGKDGLAVAQWARTHQPMLRIVMLTMYAEPAYLERARALGVSGYLLKDDAEDELLRCLDAVVGGASFVSPSIGHPPVRPPRYADAEEKLARLTPAQRAILRQVAQARTSKEIARALGLSYRTVQNHRAHIAEALGLAGPNRLLDFAIRHRDAL